MKTNTHPVPYTATVRLCRNPAGEQIPGVEIKVKAPSQIVAMLPETAGQHLIMAAELEDSNGRDPLLDVPTRARSWKRDGSSREMLSNAIKEGLDDEIRLLITVTQWHAIGTLCGKLGITPGEWYLGSAAYNANLTERAITKALESIPAIE